MILVLFLLNSEIVIARSFIIKNKGGKYHEENKIKDSCKI